MVLRPLIAAACAAVLATSTAARPVHVPAFVVDTRGRSVDLDQAAFEVFEDGIPQPTTALVKPEEPLDVTVAIDISSSMEVVLPEVRLALNDFLVGLRDTDVARLFTFSDRISEVPRARTWSLTLDGLIPRGATALYDGLFDAAGLIASGRAKRVLVIFSDSDDRGSRASITTVTERVLTMDAALFWVILGPDRSPRQVRDAFDNLAASTGGRVVRVNRGQLRRTFEDLRTELGRFYLITYQSLRDTVDGRLHTIEVRTPGRRDVRVRARTQYIDAR